MQESAPTPLGLLIASKYKVKRYRKYKFSLSTLACHGFTVMYIHVEKRWVWVRVDDANVFICHTHQHSHSHPPITKSKSWNVPAFTVEYLWRSSSYQNNIDILCLSLLLCYEISGGYTISHCYNLIDSLT